MGSRIQDIVFFVTLNRALIGGLAFLESGTRTLPHGAITATFDTSEKNRREKGKAIEESGDRLHHSPEVLLHHFLEVLGEPLEVQKLAQTLCDHTTGATAAVLKGWTSKPKGKKNPDGSGERQYTSAFHGCHLLPAPGTGFLHGALGSFKPTPECGWSLRGRHNETRRTNYSLLEFMEIEVPPGGAEAKRQEAYRKGYKALRRVVVELGEGLLAVLCAGKWHDLGQPMEEAKAIYLLTNGRVYPFFKPGWIDRIRTAYELKIGGELPKTAEEASAARWKKPVTDEEGFPITIQIKATMEKRGMNQAQTAAELGVSKMTMSRWMRGKAISPESTAKLLEWIAKDKAE
jgi:DNA-binding transcriptional regulator YiaG